MNTSITTIKRTAWETLQELSPQRVQVALDFLFYLKEKDWEGEATDEVLQDKRLLRDIRVARRDWKDGRRNKFTSWRTVKRYV